MAIISGIYKIESKLKPNRCYIGSTSNFNKRKREHLNALRRGDHHSVKLQRHYGKYGEDDLVFAVLLCCLIDDLIETEQFFLDSYKHYFNGYNSAIKPNRNPHPEERKKKKSEQVSEYIRTHPEIIGHLSNCQKKFFSYKENRDRQSAIMREYYKNNPQTEETKKKRLDSCKETRSNPDYVHPLKGKKPDPDRIRRQVETHMKTMRDPNYKDPRKGVKMSQETIDKRKAAWAKTKSDPDYINPLIGRTLSAEHKKNISNSVILFHKNKKHG